MNPRDEIWIFI